jgi:CO/xanthine dehydrogenase FAD-binding subunit
LERQVFYQQRRWIIKTLKPFSYFKPATAAEAVGLLVRYQGKSKIIAGGTDLMVLMKERVLTPENVIDIKSIPWVLPRLEIWLP